MWGERGGKGPTYPPPFPNASPPGGGSGVKGGVKSKGGGRAGMEVDASGGGRERDCGGACGGPAGG